MRNLKLRLDKPKLENNEEKSFIFKILFFFIQKSLVKIPKKRENLNKNIHSNDKTTKSTRVSKILTTMSPTILRYLLFDNELDRNESRKNFEKLENFKFYLLK